MLNLVLNLALFRPPLVALTRSLKRSGVAALGSGLAIALFLATPGKAAERLLLPLDAPPKIQGFLSWTLKLNEAQVEHFLSSPLGASLLAIPSDWIELPEGDAQASLRQAMVRAAAEPEGLTLLGILRQLPPQAQVNAAKVSAFVRQRAELDQQTEAIAQSLAQKSQAIARTESFPPRATALDPRRPGPFTIAQQSLTLRDTKQDPLKPGKTDRPLQADLYLPQEQLTEAGAPASIPVVILSHGLGANREGHAFFARHLASYGIAAIMVQHPGSDTTQLQAMLQGERPDAMEISAFIDRPRDISWLLDELEHRNAQDFHNRLKLDRVALYGHSLGAYTALALAGAEPNFAQLEQDCTPQKVALNPSLVVQCRALALPRERWNLRDRRIAALLLFDPVGRSIFGPQGLKQVAIPVFWGGDRSDLLTPLATEQLPAFEALGSREKYFSLTEGVQHINFQWNHLTQARSLMETELIAAKPLPYQTYVNALGLAFVQVQLGQKAAAAPDRSDYRPYLSASYAQQLSTASYPLSFIPPNFSLSQK